MIKTVIQEPRGAEYVIELNQTVNGLMITFVNQPEQDGFKPRLYLSVHNGMFKVWGFENMGDGTDQAHGFEFERPLAREIKVEEA